MLILGRWRLRIGARWLATLLLGSILLVTVAAAAAAAVESRTVSTYWRGLWWAVSLVTTVGFIGEPPETRAGALLSAVLMVVGFLLLALVSASLAAFFVREEEMPREEAEDSTLQGVMASLRSIEERLANLESAVRERADSGSEEHRGGSPGYGESP